MARALLEDEEFRGEEEGFHLQPGVESTLRLVPRHGAARRPDGEVHALDD